MANKNVTIKDSDGNSCFPKTFDFNVFNSSNQSLNNLLSNIDATKMKVFPYSAYDCNTCYDAGIYEVANGTNCPSGSPYGTLLVLPYRKAFGNVTPDFATQIFIPNGDDASKPNSMFFRTALSTTWNAWQQPICVNAFGGNFNDGGIYVKIEPIKLMIQFGYRSLARDGGFTLSQPYRDTNFSFICYPATWTGSYGNYGSYVTGVQTVGVAADKATSYNWIAIGFYN